MATQKKTGGTRTAGRRSSSNYSGRRTAPQGKSGSKGRQTQPYRREAGAVVCLLLAIFAGLGYFNMEAIFIDLFCGLIKGLLGYGFWLMPPALLLCSYVLMFHRGRPVRLRVTCALLLPLILSCFLHVLLAQPLEWDAQLWGSLVESGKALQSGGGLGGVLGQGLVSLFTKIGAAIVSLLAGLLLGLAAFNRTVLDAADWFFSRPRYEPEPEPAPRRERRPERERREESVPARTARPSIDIPVEDGPLVGQEPRKKKGFFNRSPRVPAPDQILRPQEISPAESEEDIPETKKEAVSDHMPVPDLDFLAISKPEPITQPGERAASPVSYTHLTLPTILLV